MWLQWMKIFRDAGERQVVSRSQVGNSRVKYKSQMSRNAISLEDRRMKYQLRHLVEAPLNLRNEDPPLI